MEELNYFESKAIEAKELGDIYNFLQNRLTDVQSKWAVIGKKDEQAKDWKTGELMFEDDGSPMYRDEYGYVPKTADELTAEDHARITTIKNVMKLLEKAL